MISLNEQKQLDRSIKQLRIMHESLKDDCYTINPDVRNLLDILMEIVILLYEKNN